MKFSKLFNINKSKMSSRLRLLNIHYSNIHKKETESKSHVRFKKELKCKFPPIYKESQFFDKPQSNILTEEALLFEKYPYRSQPLLITKCQPRTCQRMVFLSLQFPLVRVYLMRCNQFRVARILVNPPSFPGQLPPPLHIL